MGNTPRSTLKSICHFFVLNRYLNVQRIPHTNLILVIVEAKCTCDRRRMSIVGREVMYPLFPDFVNQTAENPVLLEICRRPQNPLYRKRITHCYAYNKDVSK
jgi:hypothetical protein